MVFLDPSSADDGKALAVERYQVERELQMVRRRVRDLYNPFNRLGLNLATRRETLSNTRAYRDLLEGRLSRIVEQQQALCRNCLGTGREPDPNILLIYCPVCLRVDPVHAPNVRYFNNL